VEIHSFEFDPGLSEAFAAFREELYRGDCNWIPTSRSEFLSQFAPGFSFYQSSGNRHRHFIATANGKTVGHVSAFVNRDLKDEDGSTVGSLGFFECIDDYAAAGALLEYSTEWLRKDNHLHRIWAPINFDIWHGYRLMTRGFAEKTFYGEPYNRTYYPAFFTRFGFSLKKTWDSLERDGRANLEKIIARFEPRYRRLLDEQYRFQSIDVSQKADLQQLYRVLVRSYQGFLGTTPFGFDGFEGLLGRYLKAFEARFVNLVYDPSGTVAAFSVAYPDYSDALRATHSKAYPSGQPGFCFQPNKADRVIFYMIGATPEEVQRRHGLGSATFYYTVQEILSAGFQTVLFAIIADDSGARRHLGEAMRFAQRTYTLYELNR
jgi:hypothetical protein